MSNYKEKLKGMLDVLSSNSKINVKHSLIGDASPEAILDTIIAKSGISYLSDTIYQFYKDISIFEVEWDCDLRKNNIELFNEHDNTIEGSIKLLSIENVLVFDKKLDSRLYDINEAELEDLKNFRYFDASEDYILIGTILNKTKMTDKLYYLQYDVDGFMPFSVNFEEYLSKLISHKGFVGWAYNFLYPTTDTAKRMNHYLNRIF